MLWFLYSYNASLPNLSSTDKPSQIYQSLHAPFCWGPKLPADPPDLPQPAAAVAGGLDGPSQEVKTSAAKPKEQPKEVLKQNDGASGSKETEKPEPEKPTERKRIVYELGWSEEHMCAWRKQVLGISQRGPIEYSAKPTVDESVDQDSPIVCTFGDGEQHTVSHITMVSWLKLLMCFILVLLGGWFLSVMI